jgi:hypothetical protein
LICTSQSSCRSSAGGTEVLFLYKSALQYYFGLHGIRLMKGISFILRLGIKGIRSWFVVKQHDRDQLIQVYIKLNDV